MMTMGQRIGQCRKGKGMTQESLANILGVTNQAVSKWESDQCYPDVALLPKIADCFAITLDQLFGRETALPPAQVCQRVEDLPWPDDDTLRAVVYQGHRLLAHMNAVKDMTFAFQGQPVNLESAFSVQCAAVSGDVTAGHGVSCGSVGGNVEAGGSVACGDVKGDVNCGGRADLQGSVGGSIDAGGSVTCGEVSGDVDCGGSAEIRGSVQGDVDAGAGVTCGDVGGDVDAGTSVTCGDIGGNADAGIKIVRGIYRKNS